MIMQVIATLIGVVGKQGHGVLDNGNTWETDRVELHVLADFPSSDSMAHGKTCTVYQVQGFNLHHQNAINCLDQQVELSIELIPSKKLGTPPKMVCVGFKPTKTVLNRPAVG